MPSQRILVTAVLTCVPLALSSQQQRPTFRSSRDVLTIEASVRDSAGKPVTDLQPDDFVVKIDGESRRVFDAQVFGTGSGRVTAAANPVPRSTKTTDTSPGRVVIIAVDRDSIRAGSEKPALDTAAAVLASLSPADAVGTIGLPVGGSDPTRDHAVAATTLKQLTGTRPQTQYLYRLTWDEAAAYENRVQPTIEHVIERECQRNDPQCPGELARQAKDMLFNGRAQAESTLQRLTNLIAALAVLRAPKHLVLLSGGLPFDAQLMGRYEDVARKAAQSRVALSVVHLDQARFEAADQFNGLSVYGGREYATGLGTIAAMTGGVFLGAVGKAQGTFDRIVSDINYFYQLGVEVRSSDGDGRSHRVEIKVNRPNVSVRAPSQIAAMPQPKESQGAQETMKRALSQPTDVAALPLEVATYVTHAAEPDKVRLLVSAAVSDAPGIVPVEWGYVVLDGDKVVGSSRAPIPETERAHWSSTTSIEIPAGKYRIRTAVIGEGGRVGSLDLPLTAGLRAASGVQASDLLVGTATGGRLVPQARLKQNDKGVAMLELSSNTPLAETSGRIELIMAGTAQPRVTQALELRARGRDATVVVAQAALDLSSLSPSVYMASAVLEREGKPFARISRLIEIIPAEEKTEVAPAPAAAAAATTPRDPDLAGLLAKVGKYADGYGDQASMIVAVERYEQGYPGAPLGQPSGRKLVAELVLVKTSDATGWVGYRDVISVDGKTIRDRQDRLQSLFRAGTPDVAEARRIADESARFNIGPVRRNFNEPTAALLFLRSSGQSRFEFTRRGNETLDKMTAAVIDFAEKTRPTLVRTQEGRDVPVEGTIFIEPETGTILRTRLVLRGFDGLRSSSAVTVNFARNERLGLWLPAVMSERHEGNARIPYGTATALRPAVVTATATYDEFKRFEVSTAISDKH